MIERPILFAAPMVRAILAGHKTMTRRIVDADKLYRRVGDFWPLYCTNYPHESMSRCGLDANCPYGVPGDRLWVRESWWQDVSGGLAAYAADCHPKGPDNTACRLRPSIHMPRWASRITLDVVSVRVERLQEITAEDVQAEGVRIDSERVARMQAFTGVDPLDNVRASFACTWDYINSKRAPWESNPWVWRIEFQRLRGES